MATNLASIVRAKLSDPAGDFHRVLVQALPDSFPTGRFIGAMASLAGTPNLAECDPSSVLRAAVEIAGSGLDPAPMSKHIHPIARSVKYQDANGRDQWRKELDWMLDWRGARFLIQAATGCRIDCRTVHIDDLHECHFDRETFVVDLHVPAGGDPYATRTFEVDVEARTIRGLRGGYVWAELPDGGRLYLPIPASEILSRMSASRSYKRNAGGWVDNWTDPDGPWRRHTEAMIRKSMIHLAHDRGWPDLASDHSARERLATSAPAADRFWRGRVAVAPFEAAEGGEGQPLDRAIAAARVLHGRAEAVPFDPATGEILEDSTIQEAAPAGTSEDQLPEKGRHDPAPKANAQEARQGRQSPGRPKSSDAAGKTGQGTPRGRGGRFRAEDKPGAGEEGLPQ